MNKRSLLLFSLGVLLSCQSDPENGQTGSPGIGCDTCRDTARNTVLLYNTITPPPVFTGAECVVDRDGAASTHCRCLTATDPVELGREGPCFGPRLRGGRCLAPADQAPCCDLLDPHSCDAACANVAQRLKEDSELPANAELFYEGCNHPGGRFCAFVVKAGDRCYRDNSSGTISEPAYDCALGGEAIASQPEVRPGSDNPWGGCPAGGAASPTATGGSVFATGGTSGAGN